MRTTVAPGLDVKAIAERYLDAWAAGDPDAIIELHTDDTQFWTHAGRDPVTGRESVRAAFAETFTQFPRFRAHVYRLICGERHWVLDWALQCTLELGGENREVSFDCLDVCVISEDGLIERKDTFIDMVQARAALNP